MLLRAVLASLPLALCLTAAACGDSGTPGDAPGAPNVLLVVIDTLRSDHLSVNGYARPTTPRLQDFAGRATRFTHAESPRAKTTPAVSSLLTGLYPQEHGVRDLAGHLSSDIPVLAEAFRRGGYTTAAIVGNFVLRGSTTGLARGFDAWIDDLPDVQGVPPDDVPQRKARSLADGALVALGLATPPSDPHAPAPHAPLVQPDRPWFLYLHFMDPHGSYDPPPEDRLFGGEAPDPIPTESELPADPLHSRRVTAYNAPPECLLPDGRIDAAAVRALYDGEIHFVDAQIGRLLAALDEAGLADNTLVVITADHGESLGEHRYWFEHGLYAYEATCRVPLLIAGPGIPTGHSDSDISLVDLAPTMLDLAGLPPLSPPPGRTTAAAPSGHSFARFLREAGTGRPDNPVFVEKTEGESLAKTVQIKGVRLRDWKFLRRYAYRTAADAPMPRELVLLSEELYDLSADPHETINLADAPPPGAPMDRLRAELLRFSAADVHFTDLAEQLAAEREQLDPEAFRVMQALGYFGDGGKPPGR